jgi:hypothetical protein
VLAACIHGHARRRWRWILGVRLRDKIEGAHCVRAPFSRQGNPAAASRYSISITAAVKHTRAHSHGGLYRNGRRCNRRTSAECQRKAHESARVGLWRPRQSATNSKYSQSATRKPTVGLLQLSLYIHVLIPTSAPAPQTSPTSTRTLCAGHWAASLCTCMEGHVADNLRYTGR